MDNEQIPSTIWHARLHRWGLFPLAEAGLDILQPLAPFAAQALYVLQPTLGLVVDARQVGQWAAALEDPDTLAQWRTALDETTKTHE